MASSLPLTTAAVASLCSWYCSIVIGSFPASAHAFERASASGTCTVSFCTATLKPHALSGVMPFGLPVGTAHEVPALK